MNALTLIVVLAAVARAQAPSDAQVKADSDKALQQAAQEAQQTVQQAPNAEPRIAEDDSNIEIDTNLVKLYASVADAKNNYYANLRPENFEVKENGKKQDVAKFWVQENPVSFGLVFDVTGSMSKTYTTKVGAEANNLALAQAILIDMLKERLKKDEYLLALVRDSANLKDNLIVKDYTHDISHVLNLVADQHPEGFTPLYATVLMTLQRMDEIRKEREDAHLPNNPRRALIVVTDGEDNRTSKRELDDLKRLSRETDVELFIIIAPGAQRLYNVYCHDPRTGEMRDSHVQIPAFFPDEAEIEANRRHSCAMTLNSLEGAGGDNPGSVYGSRVPSQGPESAPAPSMSVNGNVQVRDAGPAGLELARQFSEFTGGRAFDSASPGEIQRAFTIVNMQTRYSYVLGYHPKDVKNDGKWHKLEVKTKNERSVFPGGVPEDLHVYTNSHRCAPKDGDNAHSCK